MSELDRPARGGEDVAGEIPSDGDSLAHGRSIPVNVRDFGVDPTGASDCRPAMQKAMDAAVRAGRSLVIPEGTYRLDGAVTNLVDDTRHPVHVSARAAHFLQGGNQPVVDFAASMGVIYPVTSIEEAAESTASVGGDATTVQMLTFTLATGADPGYDIGDRVKLVADDVIPGGRPETGDLQRRMGADFLVFSSVGNVVKVIGSLASFDGSFTVNVRLVRLGNELVSWDGGTFDTTSLTNVIGYFRLTAMSFASITNVTFLKAASQIVQTRACFRSTVDNVAAKFATNNPHGRQYGYVLLDSSGSYNTYTRLFGAGVRHVFTDDSGRVAADGTTLEQICAYGSTRGVTVDGVTGVGCLSEVVSPHANSRDGVFTNISAFSSRGGVAHRGRNHTYRDVSTFECDRGFTAFTESGVATTASHDFVLDGARFRNSRLNDIRLMKNFDGPDAGKRVTTQDRIANVFIDGASNGSISLCNSAVFFENLHLKSRASLPAGAHYIEKDNSTVRAAGAITVDMRGVIGGSDIEIIHTAATNGDAGSWRGGHIQVFGSATELARVAFLDSGRSTHQLECSVSFESPIARTRISSSRGPGSLLSFQIGRGSAPALTSAWVPLPDDFLTAASSGEWLRVLNEAVVTYAVEATTPSQVLHKLLQPNRMGQVLQVVNVGSQPFTVRHGASEHGTDLAGGGDQAIDVGGRVHLQWLGTSWRQFG